jgi:ribonuclease R
MTSAVPTRDELLAFIRESDRHMDKRDLARAFKLKGQARIDLKELLREMEDEGLLERGRGKKMGTPGTLPSVTVVDVVRVTDDGDLLAHPAGWRGDEEPPRILFLANNKDARDISVGSKVLARLTKTGEQRYTAQMIRHLKSGPRRFLAVVAEQDGALILRAAYRGDRNDYRITSAGPPPAPGTIVWAAAKPGRRSIPSASVVETLGHLDEPNAISALAIAEHDIPVEFPAEAVAEAEAAQPVTLEDGREDLRHLPLVTIDGADARDFDDAVHAEALDGGGWRITVAIADVAWYVRPGSALDREAEKRGNSVYFPDRVVPMLPEALSNDLCSLRPDGDRACMAAVMEFDANGIKRGHRFVRGLMRSAARLIYEDVQAAIDGKPNDQTGPLLEPVIKPLYAAYEALAAARAKRGPLELEMAERVFEMDEERRRIQSVVPRDRLDSHRLIEDFMIAANVAAAETLTDKLAPCLFRIHDKPDPARIESLAGVLGEMGIKASPNAITQPRQFTELVRKAEGTEYATLVSELVLRAQAQAVYHPENIGHFGLALARYAHFTSPIRRYSDLIVHRSLISTLRLGKGGLEPDFIEHIHSVAEHISMTERRAAAAERQVQDRFAAAYLSDRIGETFQARVTGLHKAGVFVRVADIGAEGLVPRTLLPDDYWEHDQGRHMLIGRYTGLEFRLGDPIEVILQAAEPISGGLLFAAAVSTPSNTARRGPSRPGGRPGNRSGKNHKKAKMARRKQKGRP